MPALATTEHRVRSSRRAVTAMALALWVAGCAPVGDKDFWGAMPLHDVQGVSDDAMAALARGDYDAAEVLVTRALRAEPRNPYALLTAATLYQDTGRHARARQAYEEILALPDLVPVKAALWGAAPETTAQDLARRGLVALQDASIAGAGPVGGGGLGRMTGAAGARPAAVMPLGVVPAVRMEGAALMAGPAGASAEAPAPGLDGRPEPAVTRFDILRDLRDAGLITQEEYFARRQANLGALLPLTQKAPAAGLDRPVSDAEVVADRLRQLRQAYEARYISAAQHAAERDIILDSLLPADPKVRAPEARAPEGVVDVAAAVGRLERLREAGLVTSGEYAAERAKLQAALRAVAPAAVSPATAKAAPPPTPKPKPAPTTPSGAGGAGGAGGTAAATLQAGSDAMALAARAERRPTLLVPGAGATPPVTEDDAFRASGETFGKEGETVLPAMPVMGGGGPGKATAPAPAAELAVPAPRGEAEAAVHLASFRSEDKAQQGWRDLVAKYPALAAYSARIVRVELPTKGTFFRVLAAPLAGPDAAKALCADLRGQYCDPVVLTP